MHNGGMLTCKVHDKAVVMLVNLTCKGGDHGLVLYTILSRAYWSTPPGTKQGRAFSPPSNTPAAAAPSLTCVHISIDTSGGIWYRKQDHSWHVVDAPHMTVYDITQRTYRCLDS